MDDGGFARRETAGHGVPATNRYIVVFSYGDGFLHDMDIEADSKEDATMEFWRAVPEAAQILSMSEAQ